MVSFRAGLVQALHDVEDAEPALPAGSRDQDDDHQLHGDDGGVGGPVARARRPDSFHEVVGGFFVEFEAVRTLRA